MNPTFVFLGDWLRANGVDSARAGTFGDHVRDFIQTSVHNIAPCTAIAAISGQRDEFGTLHVRIHLSWRGLDFPRDQETMSQISAKFNEVAEDEPEEVDAQVAFIAWATANPTIKDILETLKDLDIIQGNREKKELRLAASPKATTFGALKAEPSRQFTANFSRR